MLTDKAFLQDLKQLTMHHYQSCAEYRLLVDGYGGLKKYQCLSELPTLSVNLFKMFDLKSVEDDKIVKTLQSSGTTGQRRSQIYLDRETASSQSRALVNILQSYIGKDRYPMIIVDHDGHLKNKARFHARAAGIQGLSIFGRDHFYALNNDMSLRTQDLEEYLNKHAGRPLLLFGFTHIVWQHFIKALEQGQKRLNLEHSILLHSGGWKKMLDQAVDNDAFKKTVSERLGIRRVHNFYGMAEQTGSIFVECEHGMLHESDYGRILVRKVSHGLPHEWPVAEAGESGVIQVLSSLPKSYPGHSIITEDQGMVVGHDDCKCGRAGRYFKVLGRVPKTLVRGCSDTA